jgi:hypothetical protein
VFQAQVAARLAAVVLLCLNPVTVLGYLTAALAPEE